jgi:hypothetical protein
MRRRDDGIRILLGNVAGNQPQRCLSDFCFHENDRIARPAPCPTEIDRPVKPIPLCRNQDGLVLFQIFLDG